MEYSLFTSFKSGFGFDDSEEDKLIEQMKHVPIIHLHGQVALLPWQGSIGDKKAKYGNPVNVPAVIASGRPMV